MEFLVLACLGVIVAVILLWIVVYPALLLLGMIVSVVLGIMTGLSNQTEKRYT